MMRPAIKAVSDGAVIYTKTASDFQSGIAIKRDKIAGTLKHQTDFPEFPEEEKEGYFLALALSAAEGVKITTKVVNGLHDEVTVEDGFCVYRITDKDRQKVKVSFTKDGETVNKLYTLKHMILKGE